jgi:hypothetical protein
MCVPVSNVNNRISVSNKKFFGVRMNNNHMPNHPLLKFVQQSTDIH